MKRLLGSAGASAVVVVLGATAAFAASAYDWSLIEVDDITIHPYENFLLPGEMGFDDDGADTLSDALDDNIFAFWNDVVGEAVPYTAVQCNNPMVDTSDSSGDSVITCDAFVLRDAGGDPTGLEATPQLRVWADKALTRYVVTLENTSSAAIDYSWEWWVNYGDRDSTYATSAEFPFTGDGGAFSFDEAELSEEGAYWSQSPGAPRFDLDDPSTDRITDLPSTIAWGNVIGGAGAENRQSDSDDVVVWNSADEGQELTLAAGESISFAVFNYAANMSAFVDNAEPFNGEIPIANFDAAMEFLYTQSTAVFGGSGSDFVDAAAVPCDDLFVGVNASDIANWDCSTTTTPASAGGTSVPGIFLTVAGHVGRSVGESPVYYGSDRVKVASSYLLNVTPVGNINPTVTMLAEGAIDQDGSFSSMVRLPQLATGTYDVKFSGTHNNGSTLELTCRISVGVDGTITSVGDNVPMIR